MYRMIVYFTAGGSEDEISEFQGALCDWANAIIRSGYRRQEEGKMTFYPAHQIRLVTVEDYDAPVGD